VIGFCGYCGAYQVYDGYHYHDGANATRYNVVNAIKNEYDDKCTRDRDRLGTRCTRLEARDNMDRQCNEQEQL